MKSSGSSPEGECHSHPDSFKKPNGGDNMDRKQIALAAVVSVALAGCAVAAVAATSSPANTPLYTVRMEQASSEMSFLPTEMNTFTYDTEKGCVLDYNVSNFCYGAVPLDTDGSDTCQGYFTCYPSCFGYTCYGWTCWGSCFGWTCSGWTCFDTCDHFTCSAPDTCPYTCDYTCPATCYTCGGWTCDATSCQETCSTCNQPTCPNTCWETCDDPTCLNTCEQTCRYTCEKPCQP